MPLPSKLTFLFLNHIHTLVNHQHSKIKLSINFRNNYSTTHSPILMQPGSAGFTVFIPLLVTEEKLIHQPCDFLITQPTVPNTEGKLQSNCVPKN